MGKRRTPATSTAKADRTFVVTDDDVPAFEVRYLPGWPEQTVFDLFDAFFECVSTRAERNWPRILKEELQVKDEDVERSIPNGRRFAQSLTAASVAAARGYFLWAFPLALERLIFLVAREAIACVAEKEYSKAYATAEHRGGLTERLKGLDRMYKRELRERLGVKHGGSEKTVDNPDIREMLAHEYAILRDTEKYGDKSDRPLWQAICDRYDNDNESEKWRGHAKVDCEDVPKSVLDLVPKRERFKPKLRPSDLALLHAAARAKIDFEILTSNGMPQVKPSLTTLRRIVRNIKA